MRRSCSDSPVTASQMDWVFGSDRCRTNLRRMGASVGSREWLAPKHDLHQPAKAMRPVPRFRKPATSTLAPSMSLGQKIEAGDGQGQEEAEERDHRR